MWPSELWLDNCRWFKVMESHSVSVYVLVNSDCHNKAPQTWVAKTTEIYFS